MSKRKELGQKRTIIKLSIFLAAVLLIIVLLLNIDLILGLFEKSPAETGEDSLMDYSDGRTVYINGEPYVPRDSVTTFLLMCLDTEGEMKSSDSYVNTVQNDFLMLFVLDSSEREYNIIQVNRDTMTDMRVLDVAGNDVGTTYGQIALAHTYGNGLELSCENTAQAVSHLLNGVHIDNYAALTMSAVPVVNDYFGGIDVTVEDDMTMIDPLLKKGATVHLEGETVMHYLRSRGGLEDSTNINRMSRHRTYMNEVLKKSGDFAGDHDMVEEIFDKVSPYMVSDIKLSDLDKFSESLGEYEFGGIVTPDGESKVGDMYMEFYADDNSIKDIVTELFYQPA